MMIIVDTNVMSEMMRLTPEQNVVAWFNDRRSETVWTNAITIMEIRYGLDIKPDGRKRFLLEATFERMLATYFPGRIAAFDHDAASHAARLQGRLKRAGIGIELADCMIAGITLSHGAILATRNVRHFADAGIDLVNPFVHGETA